MKNAHCEIWAVRLPKTMIRRILSAMNGSAISRSQFLRKAIEAGFKSAVKASRAMR